MRTLLQAATAVEPSVTVVICTRNRPQVLENCLDAVDALDYSRIDVLVVDNAPADSRTRDLVLRRGFRYLLDPVPGLSHARNLGARSTESDIVAYLDDDALPDSSWVSELACEFRDPRVMAVAGCTVGEPVEGSPVVDPGSTFIIRDRRVIDRNTPYWFEMANFGGVGGGGNMALRKKAFDLWPGFDERLGRGMELDGFEEHHAFFSILKRGYRVVSTPSAVVHHPPLTRADEARARRLKNFSNATAYFTLLLIEEPCFRCLTLRYIAGGLGGRIRTWRQDAPRQSRIEVSRWTALKALLEGPFVYLKARRRKTCMSEGQAL